MTDLTMGQPVAVHPILREPAHLGLLGLYRHRWNTRRALAELEAWQLKDIGLSVEEARREVAKPFWRS